MFAITRCNYYNVAAADGVSGRGIRGGGGGQTGSSVAPVDDPYRYGGGHERARHSRGRAGNRVRPSLGLLGGGPRRRRLTYVWPRATDGRPAGLRSSRRAASPRARSHCSLSSSSSSRSPPSPPPPSSQVVTGRGRWTAGNRTRVVVIL